MPTPLAIVTGASRGLGLAMAQQLHTAGWRVLTISRSTTDQLPAAVTQWPADLADAPAVAARLAAWLSGQDPAGIGEAVLINNAAVVTPPAPLTAVPLDALSRAIRVDLEAPLLLCAAFLAATAGWPGPRKLLLISSGLGRRGMAGAAMYCAAKAGMDNLARALALEEAERGADGAKVCSLAPGVIDTGMQVQLRSADPAVFSSQGLFAGMKDGGKLDSADTAAAKVLRYLARADFGVNPVASVSDP